MSHRKRFVRGLAINLGFLAVFLGASSTSWSAPSAQDVTADSDTAAYVSPGVPHPGSDQIWWVPTFAQAKEVATATGRLILVMGSVSDWRDGY